MADQRLLAALAVAVLDRRLHHATTVNIRGQSYRLKHRREAGLSIPSNGNLFIFPI